MARVDDLVSPDPRRYSLETALVYCPVASYTRSCRHEHPLGGRKGGSGLLNRYLEAKDCESMQHIWRKHACGWLQSTRYVHGSSRTQCLFSPGWQRGAPESPFLTW